MAVENLSHDAKQGLLEDYGNDKHYRADDRSTSGHERPQMKHSERTPSNQRIFFWVLVILYIPLGLLAAWNFVSTRPVAQCSHPDLIPSPARESNVIEYETRRLEIKVKDNPFAGDPSPESDKAWHDMFENNNIRVSKEDLNRVNLTSLELADGSGHVAQLGFYHQLHCLKRIRHWVYHDYYHKDDTEAQARENKAHVDHCLEMLRESAICHADLSLSTFRWFGDDDPRPTAEDVAMHQCVKWDRLRPWISDRAVHLSHPGTLKRPS